jgi:serine/threonine-protein kinase PknK
VERQPTFELPARYEPVALLGRGGGGEVWSVRDRVSGSERALKVLAEGAGDGELMALVREAVTLSGLEGLGVPHALAFGRLPKSSRRYLLRELVAGTSLEAVIEKRQGEWLRAIVGAANQLTVLHRAGLLHGDVKPANIIVGADGSATLVDLGLATPWKEGGTRARGLTPRYAAPELLVGDPLTVRAEVYALGMTLHDALAKRGAELDAKTRDALKRIAQRATKENPADRHPSVDELASGLKSAAKIETPAFDGASAWPVVGFEAAAHALAAEVARLGAGQGLAIVGPRRSGRSTLARRLAWSLGVSGAPVASIEPPRGARARDVLDLELGTWDQGELVVVADDVAAFREDEIERLRAAARAGAKIVAVGDEETIAALAPRGARSFIVPPLDDAAALDLVKRAIPSLPDRLARHLLERTARRPGPLRAFVRAASDVAVTSTEEIDAFVDAAPRVSQPPSSRSRADTVAELLRFLDTGHFDRAAIALETLGEPRSKDEAVDLAVAQSRIRLARGDTDGAAQALDAVAPTERRIWYVARARTAMRGGDSAAAARLAQKAFREGDAVHADAMAVYGLALSFLGDDAKARSVLEDATAAARSAGDPRIEAVALVSLAIAHQRGARLAQARETYEAALAAAERAEDAWTIATTRLNLAGLAKADGDLALALVHLEGALDMGKRAGALSAVEQALFNLANLDLYLGRYARAAGSIEKLSAEKERLTPNARAQLLGLEAELAARTGEIERAARFHALSAEAYEAASRLLDGAEARLEGMLVRLAGPDADLLALATDFERLRKRLDGGFQEHEALAALVQGSLALARGDDAAARASFDEALDRATRAGQREWAWRALDGRARLAASQGAHALARRDTEAALAMLEEIAAKLPRDLREVFWNDPRRRALREAHAPMLGTSRHLSVAGRATITSIGTVLPTDDRLQRIFSITRDLARERDLDRLLERVVDHAVGLLGAERGLVVLADADGDIVAHTIRGAKGEEPHQRFSRSVAERVIREGEPVVATSAREDERLAQAVSVHQLMIQSIACVPIRGAAGATIGALYVETRLRPGVRFREELTTLAAFADQAAIAIEGARLLDELRRKTAELERANGELAIARNKLAERLESRTEQLASVRRDLKQARAQLRSHFGYAGLVGTSAPMRKLYALVDRVKDADVPVLVTGESGTGKEVVAKAIHAAGPRGKAPFLGVNCGAIPENLLESELFGHVRGAFTGADRDRKGLFREADGGTLLLDEIGELPMKMQTALLRVLQEKTVRPVGGAKEEPCDARVVAATNRDLAHMVAKGTFREDLFYRLHVIELKVPPLRERSEDIPALVDHFLRLFAARHQRERKSVERTAMRALQAFDWPGNVRQLEHVLLNAWLLAEGDEIHSEDLDLPTSKHATQTQPRAPSTTGIRARSQEEFRDVEKDKILSALARCNWNRVQAAKLIGIPRRTFYRRLKDYGIV